MVGNNDSSRLDSGNKQAKPPGRSAYEIRTDLLKIALDLHKFNNSNTTDGISVEKLITTAAAFNEFISKRNDL